MNISIKLNFINHTDIPIEAFISTGFQSHYKPYYTGWISSWSLNLDTLHTAYSFTYDQIGQLRHARTLEGFDGNAWNATTTNKFSASYTYDPVGNIRTLKRFDKHGNLLDDLTYHYYDTLRNNRLEYITDAVSTSAFLHDLETQSSNNYQYDPVGNMISDASRNLTVQYNYSNRPKFINFANRSLKMRYNPFGYRFFSGTSNYDGDVFIYSSQGQLVAKYSIRGNELKLDYMPIYEGSKRIGVMEPEDVVWQYCPNFMGCPMDDIGVDAWRVVGLYVKRSFLEPERKYELVDHLGNVRVVIADQRVPVSEDGTTVAYYKPLVKSVHDYYPYGWVKFHMDYSFGANAGSLFEDWDSARGTYYTLYRLLDSRIARWYQVEPKVETYGSWSGYSYVFNNPVVSVDLLGLDSFWIGKNGKVEKHVKSKGPHVFIGPSGRSISIDSSSLLDWYSGDEYTYFEVGDSTIGLKLFSFLASEIYDIEWSILQYQSGEISLGTLGKNKESGLNWLYERKSYLSRKNWLRNVSWVGHTHPFDKYEVTTLSRIQIRNRFTGKVQYEISLRKFGTYYITSLDPSSNDLYNASIWERDYQVKNVYIFVVVPYEVMGSHEVYISIKLSKDAEYIEKSTIIYKNNNGDIAIYEYTPNQR